MELSRRNLNDSKRFSAQRRLRGRVKLAVSTVAFFGLFYFDEMSNIILEYSEEQQCFHFNYGNQLENFNTYKTLHNDIDYDIAAAFVKNVEKTFPERGLSFDFVKTLFDGL